MRGPTGFYLPFTHKGGVYASPVMYLGDTEVFPIWPQMTDAVRFYLRCMGNDRMAVAATLMQMAEVFASKIPNEGDLKDMFPKRSDNKLNRMTYTRPGLGTLVFEIAEREFYPLIERGRTSIPARVIYAGVLPPAHLAPV